MRAFLRYYRTEHRWLLADAAVLAAFFALRGNKTLMDAFSRRIVMPVERFWGRVCSFLPFSVGELLYALAILSALFWLVWAVRFFRRSEYKREAVYTALIRLVCALATVYAAFCLLWGVNYYAGDFCDRSGIYPRQSTVEQLQQLTQFFADRANESAPLVRRAADGCFAESRGDILAAAPEIYAPSYEEFPFLALRGDYAPKKMRFSRLMSAMNFTGFYCPFTGEPNVNMDFPADQLPATVAHELAHRRGIASEQQCNFVAILVCTRSGKPAYVYSGYLMGFIHLSNALYTADRERWREVCYTLSDEVRADLNKANEYWAQFEGKTAEVSGRVYDTMLRSYDQALGMRSYGAVVDLLAAYYG